MNLFPAQPFDISSIMKIERQSFIPSIQEKKKTFEKRIETFPQGFIILSDSAEETVKKYGNALTCGYFCSEIWDSIPENSASDEVFARRFTLGHNPEHTRTANGAYLYISSFAILHEYRSHGTGKKFFNASVAALCGAFLKIKKIVLLVNEEWQNAIKIYKNAGFEEIRRLKDFFPTLNKINFFKYEKSDGIVMICDADKFRNIEFESNSQNIFSGIKI